MSMHISEVQIQPIKPRDGLVAIASVVVGQALYLGSIGVFTRRDRSGFRMTYPTKAVGGRGLNIYHPIKREMAEAIEKAVLAKAEEVLGSVSKRSNDNARYHYPDTP